VSRPLRWLASMVALILALPLLLLPTSAGALPLVAGPRILTLGDSITWQTCSGTGERWAGDIPQYLKDRDGGCYGFSGATTSDMAFMIQGGRFLANGDGQPHPVFLDRGMTDIWSLREAIDRADIVVYGLGTNDANRRTGCTGPYTPWPVQIDNDPASYGPNPPPCQLTDGQLRAEINYLVWLAGPSKPVFWYDVGVTNPADPAYAHQQDVNDVLWGSMARWPNLHVIAWNREVTAHPEDLRDGVHLDTRGGWVRPQMLVDAIHGCGYRP
jgi:hypothetical protein